MSRKHLETRRHTKSRNRLRNKRLLRKTMAYHLRLARRRGRRRKTCIPPSPPK